MLFTDTDSLTYEIKSEDDYEKFFKRTHLFHLNSFSEDSKLYDIQNEMVVGIMEVVNKGIPINNFVGLKSKTYSMVSDDGKESNAAKRVNIATVFNDFV